ncbi:MAG: PilZ domain-containing protein [Candidatus Omnitrophota bacterium]
MENTLDQEKRRARRFDLEVPVEYKKLRGAPEIRKGSLTSNISTGGVRFITDEFLPYTARLVIEINLPLPERPVSAVSKISWIRKMPAGEQYEVGNQFLEISKEDKNRLSKYLDTFNTDPEK